MDFKEVDNKGEEILNAMSEGTNLNYWMFEQIKPYINGKVLEIGSGIGNISKYFIEKNIDIELSDIREQYLDILKKKFPNNNTFQLDLVDPEFDSKYSKLFQKYDLVFALNVVEHIRDDKQALINIIKLLKPNGFLYVLVPAFDFLYNNFDITLDHYRRYNIKKLIDTFPKSIKIEKSWYFNIAGIFGWYFVGNVLKKKTIPVSNMKIYNFLTPLFKLLDALFLRRIGLSVIVVGKKSLT